MSSNLNSGPWLTLQEERRERQKLREEIRHRFWKYYRGWQAFHQGETIFAPPWWPDEDKEAYHKGWEAAQKRAWEFRPEEEALRDATRPPGGC